MKLWQKDKEAATIVTTFTVGKDREMDAYLAAFDVLGSIAHVKMLGKIGLLTETETTKICQELVAIYNEIKKGNFNLRPEIGRAHV